MGGGRWEGFPFRTSRIRRVGGGAGEAQVGETAQQQVHTALSQHVSKRELGTGAQFQYADLKKAVQWVPLH